MNENLQGKKRLNGRYSYNDACGVYSPYLDKQYLRAFRYALCKIFMYESGADNKNDKEILLRMFDRVEGCLKDNKILRSYDHIDGWKMFISFFDSRNRVPYLYYRYLSGCYRNLFNDVDMLCYSGVHNDILERLKKEYSRHCKYKKQDSKERKEMEKRQRRRLCQLYKSGQYQTAFELCNSDIKILADTKEFETLYDILSRLYGKKTADFCDSGQDRAFGYMLGRIQGLRDCGAI